MAISQTISENKAKKLYPVKVFQISFMKTGTSTLSDFFNANGVKSVHCDFGKLASKIWDNYLAGKPLLAGEYEKYCGYFDMEECYADPPIYIAQRLFKELDQQYPGSKFILTTRSKDAWLKSRSLHRNLYGICYLEIMVNRYKISKEEVLKKWSDEWDEHFAAVLEYFKNRPNDLLIFNIEKDKPEKLVDFFKDNFILNPTFYVHKNKTITK